MRQNTQKKTPLQSETAEVVNSVFFTTIILTVSTHVAAVNPASEWSPVTMLQQESDDGLF